MEEEDTRVCKIPRKAPWQQCGRRISFAQVAAALLGRRWADYRLTKKPGRTTLALLDGYRWAPPVAGLVALAGKPIRREFRGSDCLPQSCYRRLISRNLPQRQKKNVSGLAE